jgi:hypothetical protein
MSPWTNVPSKPVTVEVIQEGDAVTLKDPNYGTVTHGTYVGAEARSGKYGTYTILVGKERYRSEGRLTKGWV